MMKRNWISFFFQHHNNLQEFMSILKQNLDGCDSFVISKLSPNCARCMKVMEGRWTMKFDPGGWAARDFIATQLSLFMFFIIATIKGFCHSCFVIII
jgi:hypothetical protein